MSGLRELFSQAYRMKKCELDYFVAVGAPTPAPIAAAVGALAVVQVQFTADSDFLWEEFNLIAFTAANVVYPVPDLSLIVTDSGSGRNLNDAPVHVLNVSGSGQLPYVLPEAKLFSGSSIATLTFINNGGIASNIFPSMIGRKVFYRQGYNRDAVIYGF